VNVRILSILCIPLLISGCGTFKFGGQTVEPISIEKRAVERTRLDLTLPKPIEAKPVKWVLITPENAEKVWEELRKENVDLVLFGLTDEGYEELSISMAEIRNYIAQQRQIIIKYKEYYEPAKEEVRPSTSK
jgi:hypothetical protein